jgi:hypothetical protein
MAPKARKSGDFRYKTSRKRNFKKTDCGQDSNFFVCSRFLPKVFMTKGGQAGYRRHATAYGGTKKLAPAQIANS